MSDEPLHERLRREGGLAPAEPVEAGADDPFIPRPRYPLPEWFEIEALLKQRDPGWEAIASAEAPDVEGDEVEFVALPDGTLLVLEELGDASLAPLAEAIERELERPYRARGVRKSGSVWAVGARAVDLVRLEGVDGDALELAVYDGERSASLEGDLSPLEDLAAERGLTEYAAQAERLDGDLWEVRLSPL